MTADSFWNTVVDVPFQILVFAVVSMLITILSMWWSLMMRSYGPVLHQVLPVARWRIRHCVVRGNDYVFFIRGRSIVAAANSRRFLLLYDSFAWRLWSLVLFFQIRWGTTCTSAPSGRPLLLLISFVNLLFSSHFFPFFQIYWIFLNEFNINNSNIYLFLKTNFN